VIADMSDPLEIADEIAERFKQSYDKLQEIKKSQDNVKKYLWHRYETRLNEPWRYEFRQNILASERFKKELWGLIEDFIGLGFDKYEDMSYEMKHFIEYDTFEVLNDTFEVLTDTSWVLSDSSWGDDE
jgi:hypothetical protein